MTTRALVLAGGRGTRLAPFTTIIPKPLMPVGEISILEIIVQQLVAQSIVDITISVGYLGHLIEAVMGDGQNFGAKITYVREDSPLGTAGPLALMNDVDDNDTVIVLNGDTLTDLSFSEVTRIHADSGAAATIVAHTRAYTVDFGVLETKDGELVNYIEKPTSQYLVAMGITLLRGESLAQVPADTYTDMPNFLLSLKPAMVRVHAFEGLWLDLGRLEDFQQAVEEFSKNRDRFLPQHD